MARRAIHAFAEYGIKFMRGLLAITRPHRGPRAYASAEGAGTSRLARRFATLARPRSRTRRIRRLGGQHCMATYQYRCVQDGVFDVSRPMGTAAPTSQCPVCDNEAVRVFRAPMLSACAACAGGCDRPHREIQRRTRSGVLGAATSGPDAKAGGTEPGLAASAEAVSIAWSVIFLGDGSQVSR